MTGIERVSRVTTLLLPSPIGLPTAYISLPQCSSRFERHLFSDIINPKSDVPNCKFPSARICSFGKATALTSKMLSDKSAIGHEARQKSHSSASDLDPRVLFLGLRMFPIEWSHGSEYSHTRPTYSTFSSRSCL